MADVSSGGPFAPPTTLGPQRKLSRRRSLPSSRALVGGFLMAVSGVGVFAAYTASNAGPDVAYVVVSRAVAAGERLTGADLDLVPLDLPAAQRQLAFSDPAVLEGAVSVGPLAVGQIVHASDVADPVGGPERAQISVPVRPGNAMNGDRSYLRGGELVDVIVTTTVGGGPQTTTVSRSAVVVEVFTGSETVGGSGAVTVVLAVPPAELEAVAEGSVVGEISLARTTGLDRPTTSPTGGFASPVPEAGP